MTEDIALLLVLGPAADESVVEARLAPAGCHLRIRRVETAAAMRASLRQGPWDIVIADVNLQGFEGTKVLADIRKAGPGCAFVAVVDSFDEDRAVGLARAGARDFVTMDSLERLGPIMEREVRDAISRREDRRARVLREANDELFAQMFFVSPDLISLSRLDDGTYLEVNESFSRVTGYSREEAVGRPAGDLGIRIWVESEERSRFVERLKAEGSVSGYDVRLRCKDGRVVIGQVSAKILNISGAKCLLAIIRDVTEAARIEGELRKLSQAIGQSPLSVVITDTRGNIEYVNAGFTRTTGYTLDEVRGKNPRILKSGLMPPEFYRDMWEAIGAGGEWRGEFHNRKKNGELYWEEAILSAVRDRDGRTTHFLASKEDITARKTLETRLADALRFNGFLLESIPLAIIAYRANGDARWANGAAARLVGTSLETVKLQNFRRLDSWRKAGLDAAADAALDTGREQQLEVDTDSSFGHRVVLSARFVPFRFQDEAHVLGVFADVSARKEALRRSEQSFELLQLCNGATDVRALVVELTAFFRRLTRCESVSILLGEGGPFIGTRGSDRERAEGECRLCAPAAQGAAADAAARRPDSSCLCSDLLDGRFDPDRSSFTRNGSFWTNSASDYLARAGEEGRGSFALSGCVGCGNESIALIPLRGAHGPVGLLQCGDKRSNLFTADLVSFLEGLCATVAISMTRLDSEGAMRSSEAHLREVIETAESGYFFLDLEGRYRRVNRAWLRMHGYEEAREIIGRDFIAMQAAADIDSARRILAEVLAGKAVPPGEGSRRCRDGSTGYHTQSVHAVRENGRTIGLEGFIIDTTRFRAAKAEYAMLFEQMLDGFALYEMSFDKAGAPTGYRFLAINPAFERLAGVKAADVVGRWARDILPEVESRWISAYAEVVRTGKPRRFEDFNEMLDKHVEVLAFRPQPGRFACLVQDVTDRRKLEVRLVQAQKMEAVGQLAGGVAHDFNNILTAIMMHLSLLQMGPGVTPDIAASLKELEGDAKRAANLTRQLLMFSRKQLMRVRPVGIKDVLGDLLKMLRRLLGEHIDLVFEASAEAQWIEADPGMIEQVVMNLSVNARDAMPAGGRLTIGTRMVGLTESEAAERAGARPGRFLCMTISDTGTGMGADTMKHIFEPFFTTKAPGKGTGLGLATAYGIINQHRGWISVESAIGLGTTFRVYLPECAVPAEAESPGPSDPIPGGTESVLVVEDEAGLRRMVTGTLRLLGYRVLEAPNGREAMELWNAHAAEISLLFTDMIMPGGISGLALARRLWVEKAGLRVIISSGYSEQLLEADPKQEPRLEFLPKPYTAEQLAAAVRKCIDAKW